MLIVMHGSGCDFGSHDQQVFQRQFQLLDLALDLLRGLAEDLLLQLGDAQPQGLDQRIMGAQRGRDLRVFRLQGGDQRLQKRWIIRKSLGHIRHAPRYRRSARNAMETRRSDAVS